VNFAPQAAGLATGGVSFVSNASNSPTNQSFTGTGVQPVQHTVSLTWNASQSQVVGYYIYRSTQSGSYTTPLNNTPQTTLTYIDSTVQSAQTYYYVVTAVDSNSQQSVYSNESKAIIP
jgi:fibronectin type 3 domain-containing protein